MILPFYIIFGKARYSSKSNNIRVSWAYSHGVSYSGQSIYQSESKHFRFDWIGEGLFSASAIAEPKNPVI